MVVTYFKLNIDVMLIGKSVRNYYLFMINYNVFFTYIVGNSIIYQFYIRDILYDM